jgi:hypothetical protein
MVQARLLDGSGGFDSSSSSGHFADVLPAGCAPDAYKLFVGNVPKALTEEDLRPVGALACWGQLDDGVAAWGRDAVLAYWPDILSAVLCMTCCALLRCCRCAGV